MIALGGLVLGLLAWAIDRDEIANWIWATGTAPVVFGLLISMIRDFLAGRMGLMQSPLSQCPALLFSVNIWQGSLLP